MLKKILFSSINLLPFALMCMDEVTPIKKTTLEERRAIYARRLEEQKKAKDLLGINQFPTLISYKNTKTGDMNYIHKANITEIID